MAGNIKLTPEELLAQSTEMASIQSEFESLFSQVTSSLNNLNGSWSEALAGNFSGKISAAQKSFSAVAEMMANGATAARVSANTFSEPGAVLSLICGGGESGFFSGSSDLLSWIAENAQTSGMNSDLMIGAISKMTGVDAAGAKDILGKVMQGDYEGVLDTVADKGIDWIAGALSGELGSDTWVGQMEEATGGKFEFGGLEKSFYKNVLGGTLGNAKNIVKDMYFGDGNPAYELEQLGEMAWNSGAGSVIKTTSDAAYNVVKNIPGIGDYYAEKGVTDGEGAIGSIIGDITLMVTGDSQAAAADQNYYKDHGGIAKGVVDGVVDIGSYVAERIGTLWHSGARS